LKSWNSDFVLSIETSYLKGISVPVDSMVISKYPLEPGTITFSATFSFFT